MVKLLKMLFLVLLVFGLMAGSAFAGTIQTLGVTNGSKVLLALEAMGAARTYTISGGGTNCAVAGVVTNANCAIAFTSSRGLISGDSLAFSFANDAFTPNVATTVYLCATGSNLPMDATQVTNASNFTLRSNQSEPFGTAMFITTDSAASSNCNGSNGAFTLNFAPVSSAQTASITFTLDSTLDTGTETIAKIANQYGTVYGPANSAIDYLNGGNGQKFNPSGTTLSSTATLATANITSATETA